MAKKRSTPKATTKPSESLSKKSRVNAGIALPLTLRAQLSTIRLVELETSLSISDGNVPGNFSVEIGSELNMNASEKRCLVNVMLNVGPDRSDQDSESALRLRAKYQCVYSVKGICEPSDEDDAQKMMQAAAFQAWPYLRECVQSTTSRMGIPPLTLPLFQVHPGEAPAISDETGRAAK